MDNLITLELKQKKSGLVRDNGDFTTILTRPVEINEGDEIVVSKAFIDSVGQTQSSIEVPSDLNFTFSANIYNVNWNTDGKVYLNDNPSTNLDCKKYILCNRVASSQVENAVLIKDINLSANDVGFNQVWGGVSTTWEYKDINNVLTQYHLYIPQKETIYGVPDTFNQTLELNILSIDGVFTLISPTQNVINSLPYSTTIGVIDKEKITGTLYNYIPINYTKTFLVKAGNYDPQYFAKMITDNLTRNDRNAENIAPEFSPVSNPFLISTNDWGDDDYYFIDSETGKNGFYYTPIPPETRAGGYWVGSNQLALEFSNNRFYWSNLHMPIYDTTGNKTIRFIDPTYGEGVDAIPVCANSGVIWNSIKTDSEDPRFTNFFNSVLGFNQALTTPVPKMKIETIDNEISYIPIYNWTPINFTQGLNSIDVPVSKVVPNFYQVQSCLAATTIINDETQGVYAEDVFSQTGFIFGYYQIAIESVFKNMMIGTDIKRNISAIISRYYENNSYCSGNVSDSITYIHKGEPVLLSSLSVRILNSDGVLASSIGNDNSIYIQIHKAIQPQITNKK